MLNKKITVDSVKNVIDKVKQSSISFTDIFEDDIFVRTSENFVGFNYAISDNETCIYRFYPARNVISVLEQIQIDLISFNCFNFEYLMLEKDKQLLELNKLKEILKMRIMKENDPYLFQIFNELYLENKNIEMVKENEFDKKRINYNRIKILKLAKNIHNIQIK